MKGITVASQGADLKVSNDLPIPEPSDNQILVKSVYSAINPVDAYMTQSGILVLSWPLVPGCDAGGFVIKAGKNAISALGTHFKEGDKVCGCTRLGCFGYSPFQEYFLMDAKVTLPVPFSMNLANACTLGVATYTGALAAFDGLGVPLPNPKSPPEPKDEWALVLGGASSVGKATIQILKACGFRVIGTASPQSFDLLKSVGADECVSYKQPQAEIISEIVHKTGGKMYRICDAVAQHTEFSVPMFKAIQGESKWFTTTNDWTPLPTSEPFHSSYMSLGPVGRESATELNKKIESYIPFLYSLMESGKIYDPGHVKIGEVGIDYIPEAYEFQQSGKGGNQKVIVQVAEA